jgi:hypothetical protein
VIGFIIYINLWKNGYMCVDNTSKEITEF